MGLSDGAGFMAVAGERCHFQPLPLVAARRGRAAPRALRLKGEVLGVAILIGNLDCIIFLKPHGGRRDLTTQEETKMGTRQGKVAETEPASENGSQSVPQG